MKIAIIQRFLPSQSRGGVGYYTHEFANTLVARGHQVTIFTQDRIPDGAHYKVSIVSRNSSRLDPLTFPFKVARLNFEDFDVINAQGDDQFLNHDQVPIVRTMHGSSLVEAYYNGIKRFSLKHFLLHFYFYFWEFVAAIRAHAVIGVSSDTMQYYPCANAAVIPNGVNVAFFKETEAVKAIDPTILFVGEVNSRKRGALLMDIFKQEVQRLIPNAKLTLIGPEKISGPGIESFSDLSTEALVEKYKEAWVLCLPSSYEGFGRPYAEALAAGLPVVASDNPGAREVLKNGAYGVIAQDHELGKALVDLLSSKEKRDLAAKLGRERACDFSWQKIAEAYEAIYQKVIDERRK